MWTAKDFAREVYKQAFEDPVKATPFFYRFIEYNKLEERDRLIWNSACEMSLAMLTPELDGKELEQLATGKRFAAGELQSITPCRQPYFILAKFAALFRI